MKLAGNVAQSSAQTFTNMNNLLLHLWASVIIFHKYSKHRSTVCDWQLRPLLSPDMSWAPHFGYGRFHHNTNATLTSTPQKDDELNALR